MSADLILRYASQVGYPVGNLRFRSINIVNTPIVGTPTWLGNGVAIADVYELIFTKSGTVTCTVNCNTKNPYRNMTGVTVVCDGVTENKNLIPGVGIAISGSVDSGWEARVSVGAYMDGSGVCTDVLNFDVVEAGTSTTGYRIACENVGSDPAQQVKVYALPGFYYYGGTYYNFISRIAQHSNPTRHKYADTATKVITFANWTDGPGGHKQADLKVDAVTCITGALFDGETIYEYGSGLGYNDGTDLLRGLQIVLANISSDPSAESYTLKIIGGYTWVQFATDITGSPGSYSNQDLDLTESGQPTGTITANHAAYFWARWAVPSGASVGDMRKMGIRARGLTT